MDICKFYNCNFNGKFPSISCRSDIKTMKNEFLHEEGREKFHRDFCCKTYYRCGIYRCLEMRDKYEVKNNNSKSITNFK